MASHHLTAAVNVYRGGAVFPPAMAAQDGRRGRRDSGLSYRALLAPVAIVAAGIINAATGALLPNIGTITYTPLTNGVAPLDNAGRPAVNLALLFPNGANQPTPVYVLDVPRNLIFNMTHGASLIASTLVVSGFDEWMIPITEQFLITATGTTKTVAGKKAWKYIASMAITSAGNAQANTANLGVGNVFGLPYRVTDANAVMTMANGVIDATAVVTKADDTAPSATTGDARGTVASSVASDGVKNFGHWMVPSDDSTAQLLFGQGVTALGF